MLLPAAADWLYWMELSLSLALALAIQLQEVGKEKFQFSTAANEYMYFPTKQLA